MKNSGVMVWRNCVACGARFDQHEEAAIWLACRTCNRALWCLANEIPTEVSAALAAWIAAVTEGK